MKLSNPTVHRGAALATATLSLLSGSPAKLAAQPPLPELEPTIVTGDLWQTPLETIPASVTVLDSAFIASSGNLRFEDLLIAVPNLTYTGGTSRARYFQIRGIGENSQFEGQTPDASVRFLLDDLDFTGLGGAASLFDAQQVEILRGPQAGAFGANASAGVIRVVSNAPTPFWTGSVETTLGNDELKSGTFALGGPLVAADPERLMFRIAAQRLTSNGFRTNDFLDRRDTNQRDELFSRLRLTWNPGPDWTFDGTLFYANQRNGYDEFSLGNTGFRTESDEPGRDDQESIASGLRAVWSGNDRFTLTTVTGFSKVDSRYSFDGDWTNEAAANHTYTGFAAIDRARNTYSQELRLDSADDAGALGWIDRWTLGVFGQRLREESLTSGFIVSDSVFRNTSLAGFGQLAKDLSSRSRVILGGRYEQYRVRTISIPEGAEPIERRNTDDLFGGKLTLEYDIQTNHRVFASIGRGYRGGGANLEILGPVTTQSVTFDSERIWNYEVGYRGQWMDRRLSTDLTLFFTDRTNAQVRESFGEGVEFSYFTSNDPGIEHYGLEAEARWRMDERWTISGNLGLLNVERDAFFVTNPDGSRTPRRVFVESRRLANAPPVSYYLALDYDDGMRYFGRVSAGGRSAQYESNSHNEKQSAFTVVNVSLGYRVDNWTFTVWSNNLFDERYEKRIFFFANEGAFDEDKRYVSPADPRTFGVTARYAF